MIALACSMQLNLTLCFYSLYLYRLAIVFLLLLLKYSQVQLYNFDRRSHPLIDQQRFAWPAESLPYIAIELRRCMEVMIANQ